MLPRSRSRSARLWLLVVVAGAAYGCSKPAAEREVSGARLLPLDGSHAWVFPGTGQWVLGDTESQGALAGCRWLHWTTERANQGTTVSRCLRRHRSGVELVAELGSARTPDARIDEPVSVPIRTLYATPHPNYLLPPVLTPETTWVTQTTRGPVTQRVSRVAKRETPGGEGIIWLVEEKSDSPTVEATWLVDAGPLRLRYFGGKSGKSVARDLAVEPTAVPLRYEPELCEATRMCQELGRCTPKGGYCALTSDADCQRTRACASLGYCTFRDGGCAIATSRDCRLSSVCKELADCTLRDGTCQLTNDADCARSDACRQAGHCTLASPTAKPVGATRPRCVAKTSQHCRESLACSELGMCHPVEGECRAGSLRECKRGNLCEKLGRCTIDGRGVCSPVEGDWLEQGAEAVDLLHGLGRRIRDLERAVSGTPEKP